MANKKKKPFWDINEVEGFSEYCYNPHNCYKVRNDIPNDKKAAARLKKAHDFIENLREHSIQIFNTIQNPYLRERVRLLIEIPYWVQEIPKVDGGFRGINKPREIYESYGELVGADGSLRPLYRHIMLTIRNSKGDMLPWKDTKQLIIHEVAHTMANHVRYRPDDHKKDFQICENYLKRIS